jgi:hypothetical protein
MRILAALVLGYYLVVGRVGAEIGATNSDMPPLPTGMTAAARGELDRAVGVALTEDAESSQSERTVTRGALTIS